MSLLKTHSHEFGANLLFTEHDLAPYWAFRLVVSDHGGGASEVATVEHEGRSYDVSLGHQKSGLAPREDDEIQTVYEYRVHLEERGNPERKADFLIQPRWRDMKTTEGKTVSTPNVVGVNVKTQGANIEFEEYPSLLRKAAASLDVNVRYFEEVHEYSTIYDAARYVRVREGKSDTIYGTNGTLRRVRELVADTGYTKLVSDDRETDGYYHTVTFGNEGARALLLVAVLRSRRDAPYGHVFLVRRRNILLEVLYPLKVRDSYAARVREYVRHHGYTAFHEYRVSAGGRGSVRRFHDQVGTRLLCDGFVYRVLQGSGYQDIAVECE